MSKEKQNGSLIPEVPGQEYIEVFGAREHNLKNIDIRIPKNKLVVFTGVSGSGKSSLAFDTIYNEGQRRYMESFSAYARQFTAIWSDPMSIRSPDSPVISIEQKRRTKIRGQRLAPSPKFMISCACSMPGLARLSATTPAGRW